MFVTRIGVINKFGWILTLTDPDASVDVVPVIEEKIGDDSDVPVMEDKTGDDNHDIIATEKLPTPDASVDIKDVPVIEVKIGKDDDDDDDNEIVHEHEYNDVIALAELVEEDENNNVHE